MPDLLTRLLALAPHLWPSVSHRAEWERLLRDAAAELRAEVQAPVSAAVEAERSAGAPVDVDAIEKSGKRWHGEDHRVVSVRWEPYKPDGARQMKAKGRWQEQVGSGDYWRWQNCDRPAAIREVKP